MILFGFILWHMNQCRLFKVKSSLYIYIYIYIYIKYIWFSLVEAYVISNIVGYLMLNPHYTYILNIYDLAWLVFIVYEPLLVIKGEIVFIHIYQMYRIWIGWILWHINHCRLLCTRSFLYVCITYMWFDLVGFYGISTTVSYLLLNSLYTYISNTYNSV